MRVKDRETGLIYESDNDFVIAQWDKNPERYVKPKEKGTVNQPVNTPNIPKGQNQNNINLDQNN